MSIVLIDANLAVLLAAGLSDEGFPHGHKRTGRYDRRDFHLLFEHIAGYKGRLFTPNVLTEASNLLVYGLHGPLRMSVLATLKGLIDESDERSVPSRMAVARPDYLRLGLTDAALIEAAGEDVILLTDDQELYLAASRAGRRVVNFAHLKAER